MSTLHSNFTRPGFIFLYVVYALALTFGFFMKFSKCTENSTSQKRCQCAGIRLAKVAKENTTPEAGTQEFVCFGLPH